VDAFDFRDGVVGDYAAYVQSFIQVRDGRIAASRTVRDRSLEPSGSWLVTTVDLPRWAFLYRG
jgi:hypothetical protein